MSAGDVEKIYLGHLIKVHTLVVYTDKVSTKKLAEDKK